MIDNLLFLMQLLAIIFCSICSGIMCSNSGCVLAELDPNNYMIFYRRATVYLAMGKSKSALPDLDVVLSLKPDFNAVRCSSLVSAMIWSLHCDYLLISCGLRISLSMSSSYQKWKPSAFVSRQYVNNNIIMHIYEHNIYGATQALEKVCKWT